MSLPETKHKSNVAGEVSVFKRWIVFNLVGAMGIVVQMATLFGLTSILHLHYLIATALAVETAVLHNFFWHEHWTWADRVAPDNSGFFTRLLFFHLANGVLSIVGNIMLMRVLVESFGLNYLPANAVAITVCAILNFIAGDRIVFRTVHIPLNKGGKNMTNRFKKLAVSICFFIAPFLPLDSAHANAAELRPETLRAWTTRVEMTERRIKSELSSTEGFLALDFQNPKKTARERQAILSGEIPITQVAAGDARSGKARVPDGMIHHWRGSVFIPGVPLDFVFSRIKNPGIEDTRQEDVLDSRVLESAPGELRLFLKLQRSKIVTVVYNTEHLVRYKEYGDMLAYSSSVSTKISELERVQGNLEREKPQGHDRGFLWRMNSYWRYQQVPGGVIVECESMTLSRSIPSVLEYMIRPIIHSVARESMNRTLQSLRNRMIRSYQSSHGDSES